MAGISQTKTYGVSYVIHGDTRKLTEALTVAKEQAKSLQTALAQANVNLNSIFGGKADVPKAITELRDFYKEWATANKNGGTSTIGRAIEKNAKIAKDTEKKLKKLQDSPFTIKNGMIGQEAFTNIQKQIDQHVFNVKVKPVLSGDAKVTLQEQLSKLNLTVNVKANPVGFQQQKPGTAAPASSSAKALRPITKVGDGSIVKKPYSSPTANASSNGITQLKQGLTQLQNYIKANPLTGNFRVNYGESRTQVQRIIGNLRQYAMTKPIRVPVEVVWGNAGGQLQNILSGLQSFANGHGIKTTAKVSGTTTGGGTGTGSTLTDEQKKESAIRSAARSKWSSMLDKQLGNYYPGWKEEQMAKYDKWAAKFPGMAGAERLQNFSENYRQRQLRQTSLDKANKQAERIEKQHQANKQRVTDSVMRDIEKSNRAEIKEKERLARESQRAQERIAREQAKAQERLMKEQERAAQRQAREQAKAQKIAQQRANAQRYVPGGPNGPIPPGGRGDIYTRMRKSWYPFTGNTSFGARTPMALDMAKGMGMMFAVSGVMQAVTSSFHQVAEYENMMKTVQAILKTNDGGANFNSRFKAMEEEVRRVGRETKFTAPEVAGAARFMAMAGLGIEDINAATNPIANLALVGDNDMSVTADKMTNIMTSFGLLKGLSAAQKKANMRHTSDILTNTFTKSNTDLMQLAEAMQYAGPMSHLTGTSLEDAAAMVGVMGNAGIQSSMAGTTLRMMYQNIIKPNKKQATEWKRLGINTKDDQGRNRDIFEILKDLRAKITGTTDLNSKVGADQLKIMGAEVMSLFRTTAGAGTAALLENLGEAINLAKSNRESNGVAQTIADEKKNTISGLWAQVTSTFTDQSVNTVNEFVETIKDMLRSLRDWLASKEAADTLRSIYDLAKSLIDVFGGVAKVWMKFYTFAPNVIKWFITIQMWATQMGFLVTPIIQVIGAITTLKNTLLGFVGSLAGASAMASRGRTAGIVNSVAGGLSPLSTGRPIAAKRHAMRIVGNDVLLRGMSMGKFGYKGAFGAALQSGIAMGAWSGINGIKQIFQSLGLYLAKGIGLLMSPVGTVTAGLVTLGVTLYKVYEHVKEVNRQHEAAIINYQKMSDALSKDRENLINMGNAIGGFNVINSGYQREMSSTPTSYTLPTEYTKNILNDTGKLLPSEIVKSYVSLYGKYLPSGTIETFLKRTPDYTSMSNYEDPHDLFGGATVKNEKGSKNAQRLAVIAQWAKFATEQEDVQKAAKAILEAQSKGDLKQVHAILDQFKVPINAKSMLSMNKNAEELSKLENADKTFEFMYAQLNYLKEIADKMDIPIQNYTKAMELIDELSKQKGKISSDSIKELSTTLLKAQSVSWRGKTGSLILGKDNKVDWLAMAKQFNESIPFTLAEQQQIMYDALDNIFDNEKMDKIPEIATLVARYLPLLQNLTPFDSNGLSYTSNSIQSVANRIKDSQKHFTGMASENADERESMVKNIMQWIRSRKGDRGQDLTQQNIDNLYALLKKWGYDKKGHKIITPPKETTITPPGTSDQSAYDSKYNSHQARPTQIIFNIDQLCKFEGTQVNSLDQKGIAESVGRQMAEGLHLMFAQAASDFAIIGDSNG